MFSRVQCEVICGFLGILAFFTQWGQVQLSLLKKHYTGCYLLKVRHLGFLLLPISCSPIMLLLPLAQYNDDTGEKLPVGLCSRSVLNVQCYFSFILLLLFMVYREQTRESIGKYWLVLVFTVFVYIYVYCLISLFSKIRCKMNKECFWTVGDERGKHVFSIFPSVYLAPIRIFHCICTHMFTII